MAAPTPPNDSINALHAALTREVLAHFNGNAVAAPIVLFDDADGTFGQFCRCERCKTLQQFLLLPRAAPALGAGDDPAAGAESDASIASTVIRVAPPLAAASSSPPPPAPTAASSSSAQPDGDNDEESLLAWRSDSDTGDYPDGDGHAPDASIVNSSGAENSDYSGDDGDDQIPDASIVNSSGNDSDSDTRVPNRDDVERYFAKLQRKLGRAVKIEDQRSSNRARKRAHDWFRKKLSRTDHPQHRIEREIDRVRRRATRLRAALFPRRRR